MSNCQPNVMSVTNVGYRIKGEKKKQTNNTHTFINRIKVVDWSIGTQRNPYGRFLCVLTYHKIM